MNMRAASNRSPCVLDLLLTAPSTAAATTPTIIAPPTINMQQNVGYDPATGIVTFMQTGAYTAIFAYNVSAAAARTIYGYADADIGSGFQILRYSAREKSITPATDGQVNFQAANVFAAGTRIRFYNWISAAANYVTVDLPGTTPGTVTAPAIRFSLVGS